MSCEPRLNQDANCRIYDEKGGGGEDEIRELCSGLIKDAISASKEDLFAFFAMRGGSEEGSSFVSLLFF